MFRNNRSDDCSRWISGRGRQKAGRRLRSIAVIVVVARRHEEQEQGSSGSESAVLAREEEEPTLLVTSCSEVEVPRKSDCLKQSIQGILLTRLPPLAPEARD